MNRATSVFVSEPGDRSVLQVRTHDVPDPAPGEVQVEVAAAGVNFIDVYKRRASTPCRRRSCSARKGPAP